jgi:hypothetical protein
MAHKVTLRVTRIRQRIIQYSEVVTRQQCPACKRQVEALTGADAARVLDIDQTTLSGLIAAGGIHTIPSDGEVSWVCHDSLFSRER